MGMGMAGGAANPGGLNVLATYLNTLLEAVGSQRSISRGSCRFVSLSQLHHIHCDNWLCPEVPLNRRVWLAGKRVRGKAPAGAQMSRVFRSRNLTTFWWLLRWAFGRQCSPLIAFQVQDYSCGQRVLDTFTLSAQVTTRAK